MMPVCAWVCALVRHVDFSKLLQLQIFCKLIVPMNFHALKNFFFGFYGLRAKDKGVIAILATLSKRNHNSKTIAVAPFSSNMLFSYFVLSCKVVQVKYLQKY